MFSEGDCLRDRFFFSFRSINHMQFMSTSLNESFTKVNKTNEACQFYYRNINGHSLPSVIYILCSRVILINHARVINKVFYHIQIYASLTKF